MLDAFLAGLWCIPKFLGFYVVMALVLAALAVVGAIGYFLAKIPGIGPLFFFVLHPVLVIVAAAVLALESLVFVGVHVKHDEVGAVVMSGVLGLLMAFVAYGRMVLSPIA